MRGFLIVAPSVSIMSQVSFVPEEQSNMLLRDIF